MEVQNLAGMGITQARQGTPTPPQFDGSNVNDQLASTLNQGGLLMRMAQSKGQGMASARGLGNSTIGIDAAQRAMVDAALPIAQQNAQQTHQRVMQDDSQSFTAGQSDLDRQQQLTMQGNDFANQTKLNQQQAQLQERRDQLLYQQQLGTLDKQSQLELQQLDAQLRNQMTINNQQNSWNSAEAQKDRQQQLTVLEKQFGQETAQMAQQVVANTHGMYMGAIDSAMGSYNERYAAIMADSSMKAADKQTLLNNMKAELNSTLGMYQQLYSNISTIRPDWSQFPTVQLPGVKLS
ncbi:hypothetical protein [Aeromonas hydrophila]|uniref:hypothetical protein n=1 Tax=Aeromonas hydrophila TaxID=644 RepID=UPI003D1BDE98